MKIGKGEVVTILGPSGSGKTTLLRCLNFLEKPEEGIVQVGDIQVKSRRRRKEILSLRRQSAMVFQHYNLFAHKTVLENVMEGLIVTKNIRKLRRNGKVSCYWKK